MSFLGDNSIQSFSRLSIGGCQLRRPPPNSFICPFQFQPFLRLMKVQFMRVDLCVPSFSFDFGFFSFAMPRRPHPNPYFRRHSSVHLLILGLYPLHPLPLIPFLFVLLLHFPNPSLSHSAAFIQLNPLPDPCHLPSSASLLPFCQFHYHQISYICDPAGILSRTEAELIDRRLHGVPLPTSPSLPAQLAPLNVTGCLCDASSLLPMPQRRQCFVRPAWRDKKLRQIRIVLLITPEASINSINECAKSTSDKQHKKGNGGEALAAQTNKIPSHGFSSATALFIHGTLMQLLSGQNPWDRCDPDLLITYILGWSNSSVPMPFVARLFRRNLAHLSRESQLERISNAEESPFEVISEQLIRAVQLISSSPTSSRRPSPGPEGSATVSTSTELLSSLSQQQFDSFSANVRTEQIPLWAILCSMALLSLALAAVLLAHWFGRRVSAIHQVQKKGALRMVNDSARGIDAIRRGQEVGAVHKASTSTAGHSVTFATGSTAGERERGGATGHHMKGSMMFRQFSKRHHRPRTDGTGTQHQKI